MVRYQHKLDYFIYPNNINIKLSSNHNVKEYRISSGFSEKRRCCSFIIALFAWWGCLIIRITRPGFKHGFWGCCSHNKNNLFIQHMIDFANWFELSYQKYQNNGTVREKNHKGKLSFQMRDFVNCFSPRQAVRSHSLVCSKISF